VQAAVQAEALQVARQVLAVLPVLLEPQTRLQQTALVVAVAVTHRMPTVVRELSM
jgi:hypothetical protein